MNIKQKVILASASPRRKQLLSYLIGDFEAIPSSIEENAQGSPCAQAVKLAKDKAMDVAKSHPEAIVIGADTIVVIGKNVLGKPKDLQDAALMLASLSGRAHRVYTGVALACGGKIITRCCMTKVKFDTMSEEEIDAYIKTGEPMDKAGAYGIQGFGAKFIRGVNGCFFNVMGLPLNTLYSMLKKLNL